MKDFYRHLHSGTSAAEALRRARRPQIEAGKPPRYWAPFVLIGE